LFFRHGDSGVGVLDAGLGDAQLATGVGGGDGNVLVHGLGLSDGVGQIGFGFVHGHLVILGIDLHQRGALGDGLIVVDVYFLHVSANARAQGHQVAVYLRIVGGLIARDLGDVVNRAGNHQQNQDYQHQTRLGARKYRGLRRSGRCRAGLR
jgi:hypothetical protein